MQTFLIIDGSSMLSTAYYGNLPKSILFAKTQEEKESHYSEILQTSNHIYTNGMYGMLRNMFSILEMVKPDYFAVAFDMSRNTFRRTELGADFYKANRSVTPSPLKNQFKQMESFLYDIGINVLYGQDYEADDYVASVVDKFEHLPNLQIIVHSKDHDFMQLVSDNVSLWRPMTKDSIAKMKTNGIVFDNDIITSKNIVKYNPRIVQLDTGVYPCSIVDLLSLTGDSGDGIPGCKGVSSAAAPLLYRYTHVEDLYAAIDECHGDKKLEKILADEYKELGVKRNPINALKANRDMVILSKKLAQMKRDISDIPQALSNYETHIDEDKLNYNLGIFEFKSLVSYCNDILCKIPH